MRVALVLLAACGGGASIDSDPDVVLTSKVCAVLGGDLVVVNLEYEVTMSPGQAFQSTVLLGDAPAQQAINSSFLCDGWRRTLVAGEPVGCQRDAGEDPATLTVQHNYDNRPLPLPAPVMVSIAGSVVDAPLSEVVLATHDEVLDCPEQ